VMESHTIVPDPEHWKQRQQDHLLMGTTAIVARDYKDGTDLTRIFHDPEISSDSSHHFCNTNCNADDATVGSGVGNEPNRSSVAWVCSVPKRYANGKTRA
jgi:hypothetical protein